MAVAFHIGLTTVKNAEEGIFNPCKNPSDAWPIIISNKITMIGCEDKWLAVRYGSVIDGYSGDWEEMMYAENAESDKNPLRAAMIVFLEMQENKQ